MKALLDIGYKGFVGQEFIPTRDPLTGIDRGCGTLRRLERDFCWLQIEFWDFYHLHRLSTKAAEPSRSQPSSCAGSLSCWPRIRGTDR